MENIQKRNASARHEDRERNDETTGKQGTCGDALPKDRKLGVLSFSYGFTWRYGMPLSGQTGGQRPIFFSNKKNNKKFKFFFILINMFLFFSNHLKKLIFFKYL